MNPAFNSDIPSWVPACACLWLLGSLWVGWTRGLVRQAASLLGLVLATVIGFWLGPVISPVIPALGFPAFLRPAVGGLLLGLIIWGGVLLLSGIVFKKTDDQGFGMIRLAYGLSGAALGLLTGLIVLGIGAWGIRFFGTFAEGLQKGSVAGSRHKSRPQTVEFSPLVAIKKAVEESPPGQMLSRLDPLPEAVYARLQRMGQVFTNTTARERFIADPSMELLAKNTKLLALTADPELQEALHSGDLWALLRNHKVQSAASDAQLLTALRTVDLDRALERALSGPVSGGTISGSGLVAPRSKTPPPRAGGNLSKP